MGSRIILLGLRGSGKSTLGPMLAARLTLPFVDLDDVTRDILGCTSVREAWEKFGEARFREAEVAALQGQLAAPASVLALGGGTPTAPGAETLLLDARHPHHSPDSRHPPHRDADAPPHRPGPAPHPHPAILFYLRASAPTLQHRLRAKGPGDRPALTGGDAIAEVPIILAQRDGLYARLADHVIDVDDLSEAAVLGEILHVIIGEER